MKKRERLEMLFNAIVSQNLITTKEFIDFAVSKEIKYLTATRDLKELEQLEYIKVVHDHIEISNASLESPMHSYRYVLNVEEKTKIAARAVEFLEEEDVVYISSGTTCEWLVKQIKTDVALVVTNGLAVFNTCLNNEHIKETILLGGHLRRKTLAFYGGDTLEILSRYRFTKAFLTATSMQNNLELFISSESEASIFSKAVSLAKKILSRDGFDKTSRRPRFAICHWLVGHRLFNHRR
jgi:DeoR family lactose phosphotransferase system repressor